MTLYKYVIPERTDALQRRRIRFTQPDALNDPFELRPYFETLIPEEHVFQFLADNPPDITPHLREAYDQLPIEQRNAASFEAYNEAAQAALDSEDGRKMVNEVLGWALDAMKRITPDVRRQMSEGFSKTVGILSLSAVADNGLMWAHYAAQHQGFVVGFDEQHSYFNRRRSDQDECYHLRKVIYQEPRVFDALIELTGEAVLLSKAPQWEYEREWRMFAPLRDASAVLTPPEGPIYLFDFPSDCVSSLIIGARASEQLRGRLGELAATPGYQHLTIHQALLDERGGQIVIGPPSSRQADV